MRNILKKKHDLFVSGLDTRTYFEKSNEDQLRDKSDAAALERYANDICKYLINYKGMWILDIGCGDGKTTQLVAEKTSEKIIGFDFAFPLLLHCKGKNKKVCGDAIFLPFKDETFDCIYSFSFLQYFDIPKYKKLMCELLRVIKDDGEIFHLSVPDIKHFWKHDRFPKCFISKRPWRPLIRYLRFDYQRLIDGSYWWGRNRIIHNTPNIFKVTFLQSQECWYRMDIIYKKSIRF